MTAQSFHELDLARRRREVMRVVVSLLLACTTMLAAYYLAPFSSHRGISAIGLLVVGVLGYAAVLNRQLRKIAVADVPELRALQAVVISVLLLVVIFASAYLSLVAGSPENFSKPLDHTRALYFAVTVLSTVGFGDITPETDLASIIVSVQMLLDLVLIGLVVRTFVKAAQARLTSPQASRDQSPSR